MSADQTTIVTSVCWHKTAETQRFTSANAIAASEEVVGAEHVEVKQQKPNPSCQHTVSHSDSFHKGACSQRFMSARCTFAPLRVSKPFIAAIHVSKMGSCNVVRAEHVEVEHLTLTASCQQIKQLKRTASYQQIEQLKRTASYQ